MWPSRPPRTSHESRTGGLPNERQHCVEPDVTEQAARAREPVRMRGADIDKAIMAGIATAEPKVKVELIRATSERGISAATPTLLQDAPRIPTVKCGGPLMRALRGTARPADAPALSSCWQDDPAAADRSEAVRALASTLRRSDTASLSPVMSAYQSTSDAELRGSLLSVLAQVGKDESLPVLRGSSEGQQRGHPARRHPGALRVAERDAPAGLAGDGQERAESRLAGPVAARVHPPGGARGGPASGRDRSDAFPGHEPGQAGRRKEGRSGAAAAHQLPDALALAEASMNDPEVASEARMAAERMRQRRVPGRKQQ